MHIFLKQLHLIEYLHDKKPKRSFNSFVLYKIKITEFPITQEDNGSQELTTTLALTLDAFLILESFRTWNSSLRSQISSQLFNAKLFLKLLLLL